MCASALVPTVPLIRKGACCEQPIYLRSELPQSLTRRCLDCMRDAAVLCLSKWTRVVPVQVDTSLCCFVPVQVDRGSVLFCARPSYPVQVIQVIGRKVLLRARLAETP